MDTYPARIEVRLTAARSTAGGPWPSGSWRSRTSIIAWAMEYVSGAVAVVSWFVILFTGKLPAGLADFQVMIHALHDTRAEVYAGFLHDSVPAVRLHHDRRRSRAEPRST